MIKETNIEEKIILWTAQRKVIIDILNTKGFYQVKKEFILEKYGEVSSIFLQTYDWYVSKAEKIVARPQGCEFPIWLFTDHRYTGHCQDTCLLKLEVDRKKVILLDPIKWNRILNLSYIPDNDQDAKAYESLLKQYNIHDETDICLENYYPFLKQKIKRSWDRLFDENYNISSYQQASLWEIKREWVVEVH